MATVTKRSWIGQDGLKAHHLRVAYTDATGERKTRSFKAKKDADRYRVKVEGELAAGIHLADRDALTVKQVCEAFLTHSATRYKDGRIGRARLEMLKLVVENSIVPHLGRRKMKDLAVTEVEDWYRTLTADGGVSPRTGRERVYVLKQIEDFAIKRGLLRAGVAALAAQELRGIVKPPIKTFGLDQFGQLLRGLERRKWRGHERTHALLKCAVHLAAFCGLRKGEIMGLTLGNIDLGDRMLHIRHNLTAWDVLKSTKTRAGIRDETLPAHLADMLGEWVDKHYIPNERKLLFRNHLSAGFITTGHWHTTFWRPLLKASGLLQDDGDQFHFHALRHFKASWMAHNGVSATEIAESMGHASFDTTLQVYSHTLIPVRGRRARMDHLSDALLLTARGPTIDGTPAIQDAEYATFTVI